MPAVRVFHLAMVIDDAPMAALTADRLRTVMAPKAYGAWLLHEATKGLNLDCFVMFSSVSGVLGNPAQANYAAANAFLDSLAHHRRALGLPALAVDWGALGGEGYVARNEKVAEFLARQGTKSISPGEVTHLLDTFLAKGVTQVMAFRVDWGKWRQFFRSLQESPLLGRVFTSGEGVQESSGGSTSGWRTKIEAAAPADREAIIGQALREVVGTVLRVKADSLRDDQPLTDLGLDSLMAVEIENLIESTIGVALPPTSLMRARTIGQLAALITEHKGGATPKPQPSAAAAPKPSASAPARPVEGTAPSAKATQSLYPLTFPQRELWEASPVRPEDSANHICALIKANGALTAKECAEAVRRVVARQEVLRLGITQTPDGLRQKIHSSMEPNFVYRDIPAAYKGGGALDDLVTEIGSKPFNMSEGPLYRIEVLRRSPNEHVMVLAIHHAIADGWTLGTFVQDLTTAYAMAVMNRTEELPQLPLSYTGWGLAEQALWQPAKLRERADYWKERLAGAPRLWSGSGKAGEPSLTLGRHVCHVPDKVARATRELARKNEATLFSTLLTTFQRVLFQWTGENDIVVGTPVANRHRQTVRETMGYFAGIVPLRGQVDLRRSFSQSLQEVHQATVDSFANAMPFAELVHAVGDLPSPGHNPVFGVRFALQNHPIPDVDVPGMAVNLRMHSTGTARFDMACEITEETEGLEVAWLFRKDLFSPADMEELGNLFETTLAQICRSQDSSTITFAT